MGMRVKSLIIIIAAVALSACTSTSNNNNNQLNMTQKRWNNYQTSKRGYGIIYPDYTAPKKQTQPSWVKKGAYRQSTQPKRNLGPKR